MLVNRLNAERQHGPGTRGSRFETLNALAKRLENRKGSGRAHVLAQRIWGKAMFSFCSLYASESIEVYGAAKRAPNQAGAAAGSVVRKTGDMVH
jgi:hypothetical protein